jgi:predicted metalloprotease with PDZ domain
VSKNSIADLAGLKLHDKIISVNGTLVDDFSIDELIKQIEIETNSNPLGLELFVASSTKTVECIQISDDSNDGSNEKSLATRKRCNRSIQVILKIDLFLIASISF